MTNYSEIEIFDTMRRKRNAAVYDIAGLISAKEAKDAIKHAKYLVKEIIKILEQPKPIMEDPHSFH